MALEWVVVGAAAGAEAVMVILLTLPVGNPLRKGLISGTRSLLKPFLSVVPFCLFLILDIYWKHDARPRCKLTGEVCTAAEQLRYQKSVVKSQRNALLVGAALVFYWLLYSVTNMVARMEKLSERVEKLENQE
ncbi:PREDICTED: uncharacterized protein LOC109161173 [Ipomoea nil]|uniref:uncharacterized protein LOC109161173 n=1 Tax=Ipomoea nil TaxID=35883 RepID=UPI000901ADEB|nr:PREDICTED: uncharacterized protein LOC109161173 [Ipomoea nil]